MTVYLVIHANTGAFVSIWSTPDLASEHRDSLEDMLGGYYTVVAVQVDRINEWSVCYD